MPSISGTSQTLSLSQRKKVEQALQTLEDAGLSVQKKGQTVVIKLPADSFEAQEPKHRAPKVPPNLYPTGGEGDSNVTYPAGPNVALPSNDTVHTIYNVSGGEYG